MESTWDLTLHDKARVTKEILSDAVGEDVSKWERPQDFGEGSKKVWPPGTTEAVGCNWLNLEDKLYLLCDGRSEKMRPQKSGGVSRFQISSQNIL